MPEPSLARLLHAETDEPRCTSFAHFAKHARPLRCAKSTPFASTAQTGALKAHSECCLQLLLFAARLVCIDCSHHTSAAQHSLRTALRARPKYCTPHVDAAAKHCTSHANRHEAT